MTEFYQVIAIQLLHEADLNGKEIWSLIKNQQWAQRATEKMWSVPSATIADDLITHCDIWYPDINDFCGRGGGKLIIKKLFLKESFIQSLSIKLWSHRFWTNSITSLPIISLSEVFTYCIILFALWWYWFKYSVSIYTSLISFHWK